MDDVTVDKKKLIETLRANKETHQEIFEKAQVRFRELAIEQLDQHLDDAKNGRKIVRVISLPEPENHVADFDTAIEMLEWDQGGNVTLTMRDFQRFVQNKWEWEMSFTANSASYLDR